MNSAYSILLTLLTPNITQGDTIEIETFFTGYGEIKKNKLRVQYPSILVNEKNPGSIQFSIGPGVDKHGKEFGFSTGKPYFEAMKQLGKETIIPIKKIGQAITVSNAFFMSHPKHVDPKFLGYVGLPTTGIPQILSEGYHDGYPPILYKINTYKYTPPGDYEISMIFTYSDKKNYYITTKSVSVQIQNTERN